MRIRTLLLLAGLCGCSGSPVAEAPKGDPYEIPWASLSEKQREKLHRVLDNTLATVPLEPTEVKSRIDIYEFLLDELPFTAGVLRELKKSVYRIWRKPIDEKATDEERSAWRRSYLFDDEEGLRLQAEMVYRDERRSIYYTYGRYDLGIVQVWGRSVIVVVYERVKGALMTEARVYSQVEGKSIVAAAKMLSGALESAVRRKGFAFIHVAKLVAELTAEDPDLLYREVAGSKEVEAEALEEYRRRFVSPR
jgi:hypothetical protein